MTTELAIEPDTSTTSHGTVTWYDHHTTPSAADQSLQDAQAFIDKAAVPPDTADKGFGPPEPANLTTKIGVGTQIVSTVLQAGELGLSLARTVRMFQDPEAPPEQGAATIVLTNSALVPLAFSSADTSDLLLAEAPTTLTTGQSGNVLLTRDEAFGGGSEIVLNLVIGSRPDASIAVEMKFNYGENENDGKGVWVFSMRVDDQDVDGDHYYNFPKFPYLAGCSFAPTSDSHPDFSVYLTPSEAANGSMRVTIYPNSDVSS